jgi:hypothetical protein
MSVDYLTKGTLNPIITSKMPFENSTQNCHLLYQLYDRLCGLVATDPEVPGSVPGATRFSEK